MKRFFAIFLVLIVCSIAFADIGPSQSYSFSINNLLDYSNLSNYPPNYCFYYKGGLDGRFVMPNENNVYKFNTKITVYAIPNADYNAQCFSTGEFLKSPMNSLSDFDPILQSSIASQPIELQGGKTVFEITNFDVQNKSMVLKVKSQTPDTGYIFRVLSDFFILVLVVAVPLACIIFIAKFLSKKNPR